MAVCPNENTKEWKILVQNHGRIEAFRIWEEEYRKTGDPNAFPGVTRAQTDIFVENKGATQSEVLAGLRKHGKEGEMPIFSPEEDNWMVPKKGHPLSKLREGEDLIVSRYWTVDEQGNRRIIQERVTDVQDLMFRKNKSREEADKINNYYRNIILRERGTELHAVAQQITESLKQNITPVRPEFLSAAQFNEMVKGVKEVLKDVQRVQNRIDKDSKAEVLTENIVYDKSKDRAGSIDLVAIFSDGSAAIYDYKFINFTSRDGKVVDFEDKIDMKEEAWDAQMSEYKRMLRDVYGVDLVRRSRVIPVNVQYAYKKEGKKHIMTDRIYKLEMGNQEYTAPVPLAEELTDDNKLNKLLNSLFGLNQKLRGKETGAKDRKAMVAKRRRVQAAIRSMQLKKDFTFIVNEISAINNEIQEGISINNEEDPNYISMPQLSFYKDLLEAYRTIGDNTKNAIVSRKDLSKEEKEHLKELSIKAGGIATMALESIREKLNEIIQNKGEKRGIKNVLSVQKETGVYGNQTKYFRDWTHPIFRLAQEEIQESMDTTRHEITEIQEKLEKLNKNLQKWGKENGYTGTDIFNPLINPKTGDLVTEYSTEFWEARKKAIEDKNISWLKENYYQSEEDKKAYEEQKKKQIIWINKNWKNKSKKWKEIALKNWIQKYNPEHEAAWFNDFTHLTLKNPQKWRSEEYNFIQRNAPLKEYYDYYIELNSMIKKILPAEIDLKRNFVANIHRDMIDTLAENGINMGNFKNLWESFVQTMEIREDDIHFGMIDPITGKKQRRIPILYTKPLTDHSGKIDNTLKSKDLSRSMSLFAEMALNYKNIEKIEDTMLTARDVLARQDQFLVNDYGKVIIDKNTGRTKIGQGNDATLKAFESYMNYYLYGDKIQGNDKVVELGGKTYSGTKAMKNTMAYFGLKSLGLNVVSGFGALMGATANMYMTGAKEKYYSFKDVANTELDLIRGSEKLVASFRFFESTHEDLVRRRANLLSLSRMAKTLSNDHAYILLRKADSSREAIITGAMMKFYGINPNTGKVTKLSRLKKEFPEAKSMWEMSSLDKDGKLVVKMNGKEITTQQRDEFRNLVMYVAGTVKGNYSNEDIMLGNTRLEGQMLMQFRNWMPRLIAERFRKGRYLENLEEVELGRFRVVAGEIASKKLLPAIGAFVSISTEVLSFGLSKHKISDGTSNRYFEEFLANNPDIQEKINRNELNKEEFYEQYKEERIGQMRAFALEIRMYLMVVAAMAVMGVDWDDDGEKLYEELPFGKQFLRLANKTSMELGFLFMPSEAKYLLANPLPVSKMLLDIEKLVSNSFDETRDFVFQEDYKGLFLWEKDPNDKSPKFKYTSKFIPFWKPTADFLEAFEPSKEEQGKTKIEALITPE